MNDPQRPRPPKAPDHLPDSLERPDTPGDDAQQPDAETGTDRRLLAIIGTTVLIAIMVVSGIVAAIMVTPGPDEEALARPSDADLVLAAGAPVSWDPAVISDSVSAQMLSQVFEGLTVLDADSQVRPALAESWSVSDGGHRVVFQLREGLSFSDGAPLTAEDVRRSWLRVIDPATPSPLSSLLDDIAGASEYVRGEGSAEEVGITADGLELTLDFERPASYFTSVAASPTLAVVPASIDDLAGGPSEGRAFVASGPYVPVEQVFGELRLEGNGAYWAGRPPTERISVITNDGGRSQVDIFEDEAVDWTRISALDASWIRYDRRLGPQLRYTDEMAVEFLGFDASRPPFDDPAARRAVAMAVDWRRLSEGGEGGESGAGAATSMLPPGVASRGDGDFVLAYDPAAARTELAMAGYRGGAGFPPVSLTTYGIGPAAAIADELARELGIEVAVEQRPFDEHSALLDGDTPALWTLAWSADYPHAHDFLGLLLRSDSSTNVGRWVDSEYDALIDAAAATTDAAEQERLYTQAQAIIREQAPVIPLRYGGSWALSREGLRGSDISGTGTLRFADLSWAS